jgi:hypothetical protein
MATLPFSAPSLARPIMLVAWAFSVDIPFDQETILFDRFLQGPDKPERACPANVALVELHYYLSRNSLGLTSRLGSSTMMRARRMRLLLSGLPMTRSLHSPRRSLSRSRRRSFRPQRIYYKSFFVFRKALPNQLPLLLPTSIFRHRLSTHTHIAPSLSVLSRHPSAHIQFQSFPRLAGFSTWTSHTSSTGSAAQLSLSVRTIPPIDPDLAVFFERTSGAIQSQRTSNSS